MEAQQTTPAGVGSGAPGRGGAARSASALEIRKIVLVEKAQALAGKALEPPRQATGKRLVFEFYEHVPPADIAERSPSDLLGAALSFWRFAERRRLSQAKVRVYNPDPAADGWSSPHTIVEIVTIRLPRDRDLHPGFVQPGRRGATKLAEPPLRVACDREDRVDDQMDDAAAGIDRQADRIDEKRHVVVDDLDDRVR